ncbi:hypothetical protein [Nonomuraea sp. NPDC049784]|uniref:hypothetical protein n=1 Tax=Nonomuraea sp. NPDC049784 TaxID=3154361 RepID=UPI0033E996D0
MGGGRLDRPPPQLDLPVQRQPKKLPYVPTEAEIRSYYTPVLYDLATEGGLAITATAAGRSRSEAGPPRVCRSGPHL